MVSYDFINKWNRNEDNALDERELEYSFLIAA